MIEIPQEWQSTSDWDSHRPLLYMALKNTEHIKYRYILEIGCGDGSTPLIWEYIKSGGCAFGSFDNNKEWASKYTPTSYIPDFDSINSNPDVLFIDCAPGELRKDLIAKFAKKARIIVVHDTEPGAEYVYHMAEVLSTFKYRLDYRPEGMPHTTAVSNFIDVSKWSL